MSSADSKPRTRTRTRRPAKATRAAEPGAEFAANPPLPRADAGLADASDRARVRSHDPLPWFGASAGRARPYVDPNARGAVSRRRFPRVSSRSRVGNGLVAGDGTRGERRAVQARRAYTYPG